MGLVWLLDRALGLVAYSTLYLAVLTGVLYRATQFGLLHRAARRSHLEVSALALLVLLAHGFVGLVDAGLVVTGRSPMPRVGTAYLLAGLAVGAGAFVVIVVAVLGLLEPGRFEAPWTPRAVHALVYAGFGFATIHAVAVGTDVVGQLRPALVAATAFLAYVLVLRAVTRVPDERDQRAGKGTDAVDQLG